MTTLVEPNAAHRDAPRWIPLRILGFALLAVAWVWVLRSGATRTYVASYSRGDYDRAIRKVAESEGGYGYYVALREAAKTTVYFGSLDDAEKLASELLSLAEATERDWNYGNAVHDGHAVLGLVALRRGRSDEAARQLLLAGDSPGSPQANSFGPNMLLAKELLERGDRGTVLAYFERCHKFWSSGRARLERWARDVRAGKTPDFGANLIH